MSNHRKEERKKEIEVLRQEGYNAAQAGRHIQSCPAEYIHNANRQLDKIGYRTFVPEKPAPYQIQELTTDDFPDTKLYRDGYDVKEEPDISAKNFEILVRKVNDIIYFINSKERGE